jgi:hypothetical protein
VDPRRIRGQAETESESVARSAGKVETLEASGLGEGLVRPDGTVTAGGETPRREGGRRA